MTLYRYRKLLNVLPIILFIISVYGVYRNERLTVSVGLVLVLMVLSYFYKRSTLFLILPIYFIWEGTYQLLNFKIENANYLLAIIATLSIILPNFIRFQYFENEEVQMQFFSKRVVSNLENLHRVESQTAFYLGIFSFIFGVSLLVVNENVFFTKIIIEETLYAVLRYIIIYSAVIAFSFGLAGWIGNYSRKVFFIVGCVSSFFVMLSDIFLHLLKI